MARKLTLALKSDDELEMYRRALLSTHAAVLAEIALREACKEQGIDAQARLIAIDSTGQLAFTEEALRTVGWPLDPDFDDAPPAKPQLRIERADGRPGSA